MNARVTPCVLMIVLVATLAAVAPASMIVYTPIGVSASSSLPVYPAIKTINNSGLSPSIPSMPTFYNSVSDLPEHNETPTNMWLTDDGNGPTATITFDLGSVVTINAFYVWNSGEHNLTNRGAKNVDVLAGTLSPSTLVQSFVFNQAVNTNPFPVDAYSFSAPITVRYIEFDITSNYGDNTSPNYPGSDNPLGTPGYVGLSEVRFGMVPEPASMGLLACGSLLMLRRRRV